MIGKICILGNFSLRNLLNQANKLSSLSVRSHCVYKDETVESEYGPLKGVQKTSVLGRKYFSFQGVPYMKAPIGKLRFRDAQAPEEWTEPLDVTKEPPGYCMRSFLNYKDGGQEDASVVNVYTPYISPVKPLPVMVWIHGGGWNAGSGQTDLFGPDYLMQKDVVLVTVNYRLGPVGFLSLEDPELGVPGNAGLKDQTFALKWVQRNIANFGGDPENVTVFGESAGGGSTHYHMISQHSKGLFQKAIPMSGSAFCKVWSLIPRRDWTLRLARNLGYSGKANEKDLLEFLHKPDGMSIVRAAKKVLTFEEEIGEHILYAFGPVIEPYVTENCFIPEDPVLMARKAWSKDVDLLIGATSNEGILRANSDADKISELLQDEKYFSPSTELGIGVDSDEAREYGRKLRDVYYQGKKPSASHQMPYLLYISDLYFWFGIQRVLQSRLTHNSGLGKNYLYRFDADTTQNFVKRMHVKADEYEKFPGASHCDELPYLFKTGKDTRIPPITVGSKEFEAMKVMTETFTSFASIGDPNNHELHGKFEGITTRKFPLRCMNITESQSGMMDLPETGRLQAWNEIFEKEKFEMF